MRVLLTLVAVAVGLTVVGCGEEAGDSSSTSTTRAVLVSESSTTVLPTTTTVAPPVTAVVSKKLVRVTTTSSTVSGQISFEGTIVYFTIEGGFYAIRADDGTVYDPYATLPEEYKVDGLRVKASVVLRQGAVGFHMVGHIVDLVSISKL